MHQHRMQLLQNAAMLEHHQRINTVDGPSLFRQEFLPLVQARVQLLEDADALLLRTVSSDRAHLLIVIALQIRLLCECHMRSASIGKILRRQPSRRTYRR